MTLNKRELLICIALIVGVLSAIYIFINGANRDIEAGTEQIIKDEEVRFANTRQRIEQIFTLQYQNARTISLLPAVRNIEGGNLKEGEHSAVEVGRFDEESEDTIQQIYN
ncbi:hypothetical protein GWM83_04815, partial [Candidatus Bathyarchaeota archaeon]|nr:hypothetical protein [Candidatus Bathyarchaeota archaeon]NIW34859.1 hypothetical protein [Candidatus Bathyarchaeota archaeon]